MREAEKPYFGLAQPPPGGSIDQTAKAARTCRACHLWRHATQTVFGEGSKKPRVMLVGEQPGDQEDRQGKPFVGPSGRVLAEGLEAAGLDPSEIYTTNAVKHFKWEPKGGRRLHKRPVYREVLACYPWLEREIEVLDPEIIVCLGSTAAQALLGKEFRVTQRRGEILVGPLGRAAMATVHPSSILRAGSDADRREARARFVEDLRKVVAHLARSVVDRASLR